MRAPLADYEKTGAHLCDSRTEIFAKCSVDQTKFTIHLAGIVKPKLVPISTPVAGLEVVTRPITQLAVLPVHLQMDP